MPPLSAAAAAILELMEPHRGYQAAELRALLPEASMDGLQDVMHELWIKRHVERFGYSGWRRQESSCASTIAPDPRSCVGCRIARSCASFVPRPDAKPVRPEDLFDYSEFEGLFK
jgi:hypothetical protein